MIINDWIHTIAGTFILVSLALGAPASPFFHSPYWLWLTAFVGANLFQFGLTTFPRPGHLFSGTPRAFKIKPRGQNLVSPNWKRLAPTKAVTHSQ